MIVIGIEDDDGQCMLDRGDDGSGLGMPLRMQLKVVRPREAFLAAVALVRPVTRMLP